MTNAYRAVKLLKQKGIKGEIERLKHPEKKDGCGYAVRIKTEDADRVSRYLILNGIGVRGVVEL